MGEQGAVMEQAGADSGAQGDDEFHPLAADDRAALHVGVVHDQGGYVHDLRQGATEVESLPLGREVGI